MMRSLFAALLAVPLSTQIACADEVLDTLNSAIAAYEEGDVQYAMEELEYAKQLMAAMKTEALSAFLPDAPEGWSREVSQDMNAGLAMLGGGVGTEAEYSNGDDSFTITITADNPMVGAFAGMIGNAAMLGAKIERVGRQKFMNQDGDLSGLVDNRILIQAEGADIDVMIPVLETIDYKALGDYGD